LGSQALSVTELLAIVIGTGHGDDNVLRLAQLLLSTQDGLPGLARASLQELQIIRGIGEAKAGRIKASLELGRRLMATTPVERPRIESPAEAANLLMPDMMLLDREQLRLILMDTRNRVIGTPTVYVGSLNTSVLRVGELFRHAIRDNAAAFIVVHNHPSGDPSPSPVIWRKSQVH
jgi:DNA repair protein RadC